MRGLDPEKRRIIPHRETWVTCETLVLMLSLPDSLRRTLKLLFKKKEKEEKNSTHENIQLCYFFVSL